MHDTVEDTTKTRDDRNLMMKFGCTKSGRHRSGGNFALLSLYIVEVLGHHFVFDMRCCEIVVPLSVPCVNIKWPSVDHTRVGALK